MEKKKKDGVAEQPSADGQLGKLKRKVYERELEKLQVELYLSILQNR